MGISFCPELSYFLVNQETIIYQLSTVQKTVVGYDAYCLFVNSEFLFLGPQLKFTSYGKISGYISH